MPATLKNVEKRDKGYYISPTGGQINPPIELRQVIECVKNQWERKDDRAFGISLFEMQDDLYPIAMDVRLIRKDGKRANCTIFDNEYDAPATRTLLSIFHKNFKNAKFYFNDESSVKVKLQKGYNDRIRILIPASRLGFTHD